jgi:antitoxin (DNA-binding transcriptional repressor) of toxin-antitoxin stability system
MKKPVADIVPLVGHLVVQSARHTDREPKAASTRCPEAV